MTTSSISKEKTVRSLRDILIWLKADLTLVLYTKKMLKELLERNLVHGWDQADFRTIVIGL